MTWRDWMDRRYWTYILASRKHGTLYVGCTADLSRRIEQHRSGAVRGFAKDHGVLRLVYAEPHPTLEGARVRERRIKRWPRAWKIQLIEKRNADWADILETFSI